MKKSWEVQFTGRSKKQRKSLTREVHAALSMLVFDLEQNGPEAKRWPNYSQITNKKGYFHCHLNKQHPRYVAVWRVTNNTINVIEVRYVGTHEGINYNRID